MTITITISVRRVLQAVVLVTALASACLHAETTQTSYTGTGTSQSVTPDLALTTATRNAERDAVTYHSCPYPTTFRANVNNYNTTVLSVSVTPFKDDIIEYLAVVLVRVDCK